MNAASQATPERAPRHWRRTALLYLGLVGLPGLGVGLIIHAGRNLTPPISVGGRWTVSAAPAAAADIPELTTPHGAPGQHPLVIVQSGVRLDVSLGEAGLATTAGSLAGNRMQATLATGGEAKVALSATVTRDGVERQLAGELRRVDCESCPPVPFTAARTAGPRG